MSARGHGRGRCPGQGRGRQQSSGSTTVVYSTNPSKCAVVDTGELERTILYDNSKVYFTGICSTEQHLVGQNENRTRYAATFVLLMKNKIEITQNACIRALAIAWARGDQELASAFLTVKTKFGLVEVLKALNMLDAGRQARAVEKRLKYLQLSGSKVSPRKIGKLKSKINSLNKLKPPIGSASGAVCKHIKKWVRSFTAEELEFFSMHFPKEPWKKLADICHLNPEKDFPTTPWFLPYSFGTGSSPVDSVILQSQNLTLENVNDLVKEYNFPYSMLTKFKEKLNNESKRRIAQYEPKLDTVIWWYEDLACSETDKVIYERLVTGESISLPSGKLLERLLTICRRHHYGGNIDYEEGPVNFITSLVKAAEPCLTSIRLSLESPVVVIGDASSSMDVAIRTSTIIASLLTAICSAKLVFFNQKTRDSPIQPKTVREMLKLALNATAGGKTAPAASLYPFYINKEVVKTFIIVTDEEENTTFEGYRFADLYKKYHIEVYPAHLVFVSFLRGQHVKGQMVTELNRIGFDPKQLRLEGSRPDLTKLDDMFAQLSAATTSSFEEELLKTEEFIQKHGIVKLFESLKKTILKEEIEP